MMPLALIYCHSDTNAFLPGIGFWPVASAYQSVRNPYLHTCGKAQRPAVLLACLSITKCGTCLYHASYTLHEPQRQ